MNNQPKGPVAIINVFTVEPENQEKLLGIITSYSKNAASKWPGFISARFHAGIEKTRVTGVVYWESKEACLAFVQSPETRPFLDECWPLITHTDSNYYTVAEEVLPPSQA